MSNLRKIIAGLVIVLFVCSVWSQGGRAQDKRVKRIQIEDPRTSVKTQPQARQDLPATVTVMSAEEKVVRDAYARLMRYQSAARDEADAQTGGQSKPQDYLTVTLRRIHTGPLEEINGKTFDELVSVRAGASLTVNPIHLSLKQDLPHAYYDVAWIDAGDGPALAVSRQTVGSRLKQLGRRYGSVERYTSFEVSIRLNGQHRTYRALALHFRSGDVKSETGKDARGATVELFDNITEEMNSVLREESPRVRAPWNKYSKTSLYRAVVRNIKETKDSGKPLIPVDAPLGYLPGDDVSPTDQDSRSMARNDMCLPTNVTTVIWEQVNSPLSTNPNTGAGQRIFPDRPTLATTANQKTVRVKASISPITAGVDVFFRSFDVDDPSTDASPADPNSSTGNDNRGTPAVGTLDHSSAQTDANGVATVELTVTMNPGDNFKVAASTNSTYLTNVSVNSLDLRDSSGATLPTVSAGVTELLTVWRRVHVESDSMAAIPTTGAEKNKVTGKINSVSGTGTIATRVDLDQTLSTNDASHKLDDPAPNTGSGRFENGSFTVGTTGNQTTSVDIDGNGTAYIEKTDGNGVEIPAEVSKPGGRTITGKVIALTGTVFQLGSLSGSLGSKLVGGTLKVAGVSMTVSAINSATASVTVSALVDIPFELVDDDLTTMPNFSDTSLMEAKYKPAYILPIFDGGGAATNNKNNVAFKLNCLSDTTPQIDAQLRVANAMESDGNRADDFWVVYLLAAYQSIAFTTATNPRTDNDSDDESALGGVTSGNLIGSLIFLEDLRDEEHEMTIVETAATVAHESAHQFGVEDCPGSHACDVLDLMGVDFSNPNSKFSDFDLNYLKSRIHSPGR